MSDRNESPEETLQKKIMFQNITGMTIRLLEKTAPYTELIKKSMADIRSCIKEYNLKGKTLSSLEEKSIINRIKKHIRRTDMTIRIINEIKDEEETEEILIGLINKSRDIGLIETLKKKWKMTKEESDFLISSLCNIFWEKINFFCTRELAPWALK